MFHTALLLLPAVAYAQITIFVNAEPNVEDSRAFFRGENVAMISDTELRTWQISNVEQMKDMVEACVGNRPDDVSVKSLTPWNDLYKMFGWHEVHRILKPDNASVLSIGFETVTVESQKYDNNSTNTITHQPSIRHSFPETVTSTWRSDGELTGQQIINSFFIPTFSYYSAFADTWGSDAVTTQYFNVSASESGVAAVELKPGESYVANLTATRVSLEVLVNYTATLDGYIGSKYTGNGILPYIIYREINDCLTAAGMRMAVKSNGTIKYEYFADPKVVVSKSFVQTI